MNTLVCILLLTGTLIAIVYIAVDCFSFRESKGYSKISFRMFLCLYKVAPQKWEPIWRHGYLYYYKTDIYSRELVHMKTFLDRILFYIWGYTRERREDKLKETENMLNLIEFWKKDLRGEDNEQQ